MAGLTSTFPMRPSLYKTRSTFFPSSYFFGLRLLHHHPITSATTIPVSLASRITSISARSGGGGGGYYRRSPPPVEEDQALDISSIGSDQVRLIDEQQNMVGIVSKSVALQMAEDAELDLVILSPDADPPVVRIMDYDKYRYEQQKKKKEQQKKSAASRMDLKELKMGYNIDVHDYSVRLRQAQKFLRDGDKVKVIVNLKGRENEFRNNAIELLERFQSDLGELATRENKNFKDRNVFIILVPNKVVVQKAQEEQKKKDKSVAAEVSASV
ncbi:translation initiation factor IF3-4, chloroplastic [Coffea eugenioides]|uniref:Translation initiation factor IF3-4, chloroplastic-like isoform X1 n=1 Tax=Coffea arabica TaxID=13443 RepID=A0A6P6T3X4_COFAR|nr:translation initiation factor IF3-4, chloroplastic-like [Coffea arabica]XP_027176663.1 translation initiation factor IF3-4, chloroplastic [Coffea eugenioides]